MDVGSPVNPDTTSIKSNTAQSSSPRIKIGLTTGVIAAVIVSSLISALSMHSGWRIFSSQEIDDFTDRINQEIIRSVGGEAEQIFIDAVAAQNVLYDIFESDVVNISDRQSLRDLYLATLRAHPDFTWVSLGLPNGDFYGARRLDSGNFQWVESSYNLQTETATRNIFEYADTNNGPQFIDQNIITNNYYAPQRAWFRLAENSQLRENVWTDVYIFSTSKRPGINSAIAYRENGETQAVISIAIELTDLSSFIGDINVTDQGVVYIINRDQEIIAYGDMTQIVSLGESDDTTTFKRNLDYLADICNCDIYEAYGSIVDAISLSNPSLRKVHQSNDNRLRVVGNAIRNADISLNVNSQILDSNDPDASLQRALVSLDGESNEEFLVVLQPITDSTGRMVNAFQDSSISPSIDSLSWFVGTAIPIIDITGDTYRESRNLLIIVYSIILINVIIVVFVVRRLLIRPIRQIAQQAEYIRLFDLDAVNLPKSAIREVQLLNKSIAHMNTGLNSFRKYVPTNLVQRLMTRGLEAKLGGVVSDVTIFFSDIARFTHITEIMREGVIDHLDSYFTHLSNVIESHHGTIDKYIGDAIMAFWGAPVPQKDHAELACRSVLRCQQTLSRLRADWKSKGKELLYARFGLNSGNVLVGNFGSQIRMSYTAIGDPVNVASRLEALNKIYGTEILIGENTYSLIKDRFITRKVDRVAVYGRTESIEIFELIGEKNNDYRPDDYKWIDVFEDGLQLYRQQEWKKASEHFSQSYQLRHAEDSASLLFVKRCDHLSSRYVPEDWDGTFVLQGK